MMTMAKHMMANTTQFRNKEAETTSLKSQLRDLQRCLESMILNQQRTNTYFDPLGGTSSGMPMYQGSYSPGFLFGHQTQKTTSPFPSFISSDEIFTSLLWLDFNQLSSQDNLFEAPASKGIRISSKPQ
ncbi:unnamed protein product [Brassica oleracea]